ncbi:MAG TPA: SRPBCC family protein [Chthonomonadaceae bacterium]|nr:SRPBCC family protein [Chthonomonadaceae bacterium]
MADAANGTAANLDAIAPALRGEAPRTNVGDMERWASTLAGCALALFGLTRRSWAGLGLAALGGGLIYRGMTGYCSFYGALGISTADQERHGLTIRRAVTIDKPPEELYRFWRQFENLPRFMRHLEAVQPLGEGRSHWIARAPAGKTVEWDAALVADKENELISWRSLEGSEVPNAGTVRFTPAPGGRGTVVDVTLEYSPPGGVIGATIAKLFGEEPSIQVEDDLRRFKQLMETGEVATTQGQPRGQ